RSRKDQVASMLRRHEGAAGLSHPRRQTGLPAPRRNPNMKNYDVIFRYLEQEYVAELEEHAKNDVDKHTKYIYHKMREFYWTITRGFGLGHLHDGIWREPNKAAGEELRTK